MANTEKELQRRRGLWLENFLNPKTQVDDWKAGSSNTKRDGFRTLAREALDILGITGRSYFDLDNDPTLKSLDTIFKAPLDVQSFYNKLQAAQNDKTFTKIIHREDPLKIMQLILNGRKIFLRESTGYARNSAEEVDLVFEILFQKKEVTEYFHRIVNYDGPWQKLCPYGSFINYNNILCEMDWDDQKQEIVFVRRFDDMLRNVYDDGTIDGIELFPWRTVVATITIDFLKYGGQDRFIFCEHCGNFTFVERAGKQYCSDICRVTAKKKTA